MAPRSTVGKSGVTPVKHDFLRRILGRHAGVLGACPDLPDEVWLDLTAGDGVPYETRTWEQGCSPGIFISLARSEPLLSGEKRLPRVHVHLRERAGSTYSSLVQCLVDRNCDPQVVSSSHGEAGVLDLSQFGLSRTADKSLFIYNDPNVVSGFALTKELLAQCPYLTCTLSTLGCNVGGFKRIEKEARESLWCDKISEVQRVIRPHHDALLCCLGDASQWAYLVTCPRKWTDKIKADWRRTVKDWGFDGEKVGCASWREDNPLFQELKQRLIYTKEELNDLAD